MWQFLLLFLRTKTFVNNIRLLCLCLYGYGSGYGFVYMCSGAIEKSVPFDVVHSSGKKVVSSNEWKHDDGDEDDDDDDDNNDDDDDSTEKTKQTKLQDRYHIKRTKKNQTFTYRIRCSTWPHQMQLFTVRWPTESWADDSSKLHGVFLSLMSISAALWFSISFHSLKEEIIRINQFWLKNTWKQHSLSN